MCEEMDLLPVTMLVVPSGENSGQFDIFFDAQETQDFDER